MLTKSIDPLVILDLEPGASKADIISAYNKKKTLVLILQKEVPEKVIKERLETTLLRKLDKAYKQLMDEFES